MSSLPTMPKEICKGCACEFEHKGARLTIPTEVEDTHDEHFICKDCHEVFIDVARFHRTNNPNIEVVRYHFPPTNEQRVVIWLFPTDLIRYLLYMLDDSAK